MNATQGLIFYALRCRCRAQVENPRSWWDRLRRRKPTHRINYVHLPECVACKNVLADAEIKPLLDGAHLTLEWWASGGIYAASTDCITASSIGRRVVDGYYSTTPPASDLGDAQVLAGSQPNDRLHEKSEAGVTERTVTPITPS